MNKHFLGFVIGIPALLLALTSCSQVIEGSGRTLELIYNHEDFDSFDLSGAVEADIRQTGDTYSVTITVDDNIADHVISSVESGVLRIGLDRLYGYRNLHFSAVIQVPSDVEPVSLAAAEAAKVDLEMATSGDFEVSVMDAATLQIASGWTSSGTCDFWLQDAGRVVIGDGMSGGGSISATLRNASTLDFGTGTANGGNLVAVLGEASRLGMGSIDVVDVGVTASAASTATVRSNGGYITGTLSEASSLTYRGTPLSVDVSTSGASSVIDGS